MPIWTVPAAMVSCPENPLLPSSTKVPAVVLVKALPPLISVTLRKVPASSCISTGRPEVPMVKPLRSRLAEVPARMILDVTEAKPAPGPMEMEFLMSALPPVILNVAREVPFALVELPKMKGPVIRNTPPRRLMVPDEVFAKSLVEEL